MKLLEAARYGCTRAGGSFGLFDVFALGRHDVKAMQVKSGTKYCSAIEREQLPALRVPPNVSKEDLAVSRSVSHAAD
jgi:hypothetical protein